MADSSSYVVTLEAQIDPKSFDASVKALSGKSFVELKAKMSVDDTKKLENEIDRIKEKAQSISNINVFDKDGKMTKAVINYRDNLGTAITETIKFGDEITRITKNSQNFEQELQRAGLNAEKFLAKAQNLAKTPSVSAAIGKANEIKVAVQEGDIAKVRKLNDEFAIMKARLQTGRTGLDSWAEGMRNAVKQTIEYATSIGLVYGALNQLKQGIAYIKELNAEMTKIQVLRVEGAKTNEEIASLAMQYNELADALGATTIQVAQGSVEWLRQGKTIKETGELMKSTMQLSKLGALESAQATEYLTSILNGFQMKTEDASQVVDKLVAVKICRNI